MKRLLRIFRYALLFGAAVLLAASVIVWVGSYGFACRYNHNSVQSSEAMVQFRRITVTFALGSVQVRRVFSRTVPQVPIGNPTRPRDTTALQRRQQLAQKQWQIQHDFILAVLQDENRNIPAFEHSPSWNFHRPRLDPEEWGFHYERQPSTTGSMTQLRIPLWSPAAAMFLATVLLWLVRPRRRRAGTCAECGYDLRASPGRCPECGTERAERLKTS